MQPVNDEALRQGSSENQPQTAPLLGVHGVGQQQQQHYAAKHHSQHHQQQHHPYFAGTTTISPQHHTSGDQQQLQQQQTPTRSIPTIPEGATVRSAANHLGSVSNKSPSPQNSSAPTTGTTTTPTSLTSSGGEGSKLGAGEGGSEFPHDSLTSQTVIGQDNAQHSSVLPHHHQPVMQRPNSFHEPAASGAGGDEWPGLSGATAAGAKSVDSVYHPSGQQQQDYSTAPAAQSGQQPPGQQQQYSTPTSFPAALKLLVSNNVAGSIIGRSGQTISELQKQSSTRIKLSQTGDYYPGTQDRVCLLQGETEHCMTALRLLLERMHMLQEQQHSQQMAWQLQRQKGGAPSAFDFAVRLLVPVASCGMIIGKAGSNIKFMEDSTGVTSVRLSPKDTGDGGFPVPAMMQQTAERIVTITGPHMESCLQCVYLILQGMVSHPDICRYSNMTTSYGRAVPDPFPGAPPNRPVHLSAQPATNRMPPSQQQPMWETDPFSPPLAGLTRRIASSPDLPGVILNPRFPGLPPEPQSPDRSRSTVYSVPHTPSYSPLHAPGITTSATGGGMHALYLIPQPQGQPPPSMDLSDMNYPTNAAHSASAPDLLALQLEHSMSLGASLLQPSSAPQTQDYPDGFVAQPPAMIAPGCFNAQVLVPDSMIGSILGRRGSTLTELEMLSGTRIRASQRGEFMPGTRSRIVTIRGPTAQSVMQAQFMMSQRIILPPTATYIQPPHNHSHHQQQHHHPHHPATTSGAEHHSMGAPLGGADTKSDND